MSDPLDRRCPGGHLGNLMSKTQLLLGAAVALGAFAGVLVAALVIKQQVEASLATGTPGAVTGALTALGL